MRVRQIGQNRVAREVRGDSEREQLEGIIKRQRGTQTHFQCAEV